MKSVTFDSYPRLRQEYENAIEKVALLVHIGRGPEEIPQFFPEV